MPAVATQPDVQLSSRTPSCIGTAERSMPPAVRRMSDLVNTLTIVAVRTRGCMDYRLVRTRLPILINPIPQFVVPLFQLRPVHGFVNSR